MTPEEVRDVARTAADETVNRVFLHLGFDLDEPGALSALRKDLSHLRSWRTSTEVVKRQGLVVAMTVVTAGVLGLIWAGVRGG